MTVWLETRAPDPFFRMPVQPSSQVAPFYGRPLWRLRGASRQLGRGRHIFGQHLSRFLQLLIHPMDPWRPRGQAWPRPFVWGVCCEDAIGPGLCCMIKHQLRAHRRGNTPGFWGQGERLTAHLQNLRRLWTQQNKQTRRDMLGRAKGSLHHVSLICTTPLTPTSKHQRHCRATAAGDITKGSTSSLLSEAQLEYR